MEIIPETEEGVQLAEVADHNFDALGVEIERPGRVVYGYSPRGNGCYFPESDTVFIGEEVLQRDDLSDLVVYEHENIHFEQYRRILGETSDNFHDLVNELNSEAFSTATNYFEDDQLVEELTGG